MMNQFLFRLSAAGRSLAGPAVPLLALLLIAGCFGAGRPANMMDPITADVAERTEEGLAVDVTGFTWAYFNGGSHLRVQGAARNNSGAPQQAVTLFAAVYDERGELVGRGRSFLAPTYLAPEAEGAFEFTLMPGRTKGIRNLRLVTSARVLQ